MHYSHKLATGSPPRAPGARSAAAGNRRRTDRVGLSLLGRMQTLHGTRTVQLHDVSRWGAMVRGAPPSTSVGSEAILKCHELDVFATVQWVAGDTCGIRFAAPILDEAVHALEATSLELGAAES
jgi:hypothetical protein